MERGLFLHRITKGLGKFCIGPSKEDGKAIIDCSPVARVRLYSDMHPNRVTVDEDGNITHAEFDVENYWAGPFWFLKQ